MVIFRENTEDIYAGHRVRGGDRRREEDARLHREGVPRGLSQDPLPGHHRRRHQAGQPRRNRAPRARRDPLRGRAEAQERHVRPQGEHHEVHRGGLHALGLRARAARVRRRGLHVGPVGEDEGEQGRGRGERRAEGGRREGQGPRQGRDRRHHAAAGADAREGVRRHRDAEPERRLPERRARGAGRRDRHRARAATSTTSAGTPSSRRRTAPRPSTPISTRSTRARSS